MFIRLYTYRTPSYINMMRRHDSNGNDKTDIRGVNKLQSQFSSRVRTRLRGVGTGCQTMHCIGD